MSGLEFYFEHNRAELLQFVPKQARRMLDVGCGAGAFGQLVKATYPAVHVTGVEPSESAAAKAETRLDVVYRGQFPAACASAGFDFVCFNDVLEHMNDPEAALAAGGRLAPGATVLVSVPNVRHLSVLLPLVLRGEWSYTEAGILDRTHLRFFTKRSAKDLFERCGVVVEEVHALNRRVAVRGLTRLATAFRESNFTPEQFAFVGRYAVNGG
jgi:2-polyprenyl-3-methyl-5-hydroxy-6-metoxy-1,4-benzoquinol methylase